MKLCVFILCTIPILCENVFAQNKSDDCIIYKNVLQYLNKKASEPKILYEGLVNPETGELGKPVERDKILCKNIFYIVDRKSDFGFISVRDWFSKLIKDYTLIQKKYRYNEDININCDFSDAFKFKYQPFEEIKFSEKDYFFEKKGEQEVYYSPIRITFSKVLYTKDNRALMFAKIYEGMGRGMDIYVYGFVFKKKKSDWIVSSIKKEYR